MSNKSRLQTNNTNLQALINKANALPDAGGGGGTNMINVTLYGSYDMYYLDADGNLQQGHSGTVAALEGIIFAYYTTYTLKESIFPGTEPLATYSRMGTMQALKFKADGGIAYVQETIGGGDQ